MKNFLDKISFLLILPFIYSCSPCSDIDIVDIKKQMTIITKVKDIIVESDAFKSSNSLGKSEIKEIIDEKDYKILRKLHFNGIGKVQGVIIFRFQYNDESNSIMKKVDKKLDMDYQFTCSHFLFYQSNEKLRHRVSNYERYVECGKDYQDIGDKWTYIKRRYPCSD